MIFIPLWTVVYSAFVILQIVMGVEKQKMGRGVGQIWARLLLWVSGVRVQTRGLENMPKDTGFLYVFNHTSHFDIPVIFYGSPKYSNFGAKSELFNIPVFGRAIRMSGALEIERSNREKVMRIYKEAEIRVANGESFSLAPEGTRRPGFGTLGDFKSGPFFFAVNSKMPIVPMMLVGCEKVIQKHSIFINVNAWTTDVIFELLPPIYPDFTKGEEQIPELKDKVHAVMKSYLEQAWKKRS